jgi:hypothetical protein
VPLEVFAIGLKRRNKVGGADGIRTHDLLDAIEARSQLRHGPTGDTPRAYHSPLGTLAALCLAPFLIPIPRFPILLDEKQPRRYPEGHNS